MQLQEHYEFLVHYKQKQIAVAKKRTMWKSHKACFNWASSDSDPMKDNSLFRIGCNPILE